MRLQTIKHFGGLPFLFRTNCVPNNQNLPDKLPFTLGVDAETGRLAQVPSKRVNEVLGKAYQAGSFMTGYMDEKGLGRQYADDFISFVISVLGSADKISSLSILEIGCGTGYLLYRFKQMGASVLGIEPGPQGQIGRKKYGISILKEFFPPPKPCGKFDVVVQYGIIEHVEDPSYFVHTEKDSLIFTERLLDNLQIFEGIIEKPINRNEVLGFYCPARIINHLTLAALDSTVSLEKVRFFDDNELLHGQYYPGFSCPVESRHSLLDRPVDLLIIASWTFGRHIKKLLLKEGYDGEVLTFEDIFGKPTNSE